MGWGGRVPAVVYWERSESNYKNLSSQVTGFVDIVPTVKEIIGDSNILKRAYDGISILPVLKGDTKCIDRDFYLGCGAVVNKDYKFIKKDGNPILNLTEDFLVDYQTDPYERKNASMNNEQILKRLYQVIEKYDTITPLVPEIPYGKGQKGGEGSERIESNALIILNISFVYSMIASVIQNEVKNFFSLNMQKEGILLYALYDG